MVTEADLGKCMVKIHRGHLLVVVQRNRSIIQNTGKSDDVNQPDVELIYHGMPKNASKHSMARTQFPSLLNQLLDSCDATLYGIEKRNRYHEPYGGCE